MRTTMTPDRLDEIKGVCDYITRPSDELQMRLFNELIAEVERCWKERDEFCNERRVLQEQLAAAEFNVYRDRTVRRMKKALAAIARMSARSEHDDACACDLCFVWDKADDALEKETQCEPQS